MSKVNPRYYSDYIGFALWYYRKHCFPLYQVVWPNNEGLYPWYENAPKAFKEWQPLLGAPGVKRVQYWGPAIAS